MTAAIKLYHCRDARSFRVLWALEELNLPYELEVMPFPPRFRVEGYKDLNPLGTVPACFIDGALMTESAAIPHVLATKFGPSALAVAPDEPGYAAYMNFLFMGEATLTFPQTIHLRYTRLEPPERRLAQAAEDYVPPNPQSFAEWRPDRGRVPLPVPARETQCRPASPAGCRDARRSGSPERQFFGLSCAPFNGEPLRRSARTESFSILRRSSV